MNVKEDQEQGLSCAKLMVQYELKKSTLHDIMSGTCKKELMHGLDIQHTEGKLPEHLEIKDFKCSAGWLWCFRKHHDIINCFVSGKLLSTYVDAPAQFFYQLL